MELRGKARALSNRECGAAGAVVGGLVAQLRRRVRLRGRGRFGGLAVILQVSSEFDPEFLLQRFESQSLHLRGFAAATKVRPRYHFFLALCPGTRFLKLGIWCGSLEF